jgi:alkyl hydroperoxide reductase subunit AhpC
MAQLEPLAGEFQKKGVQLAYVAAEKRGGMFKPEQYMESSPVSFPFLLDENRAVTKLYGIYHRIGATPSISRILQAW